ncbi:hypothetical protein M0Q50_05275 [bacterium]|jgi:hypothetical protein|nr:hypothetical protein [bacterium]
MKRIERLKNWVDTLEPQMVKDLLVECVDNLVDFEYINFYEDSKSPYWDGNGERLDGTEDEDVD